MSAAILSVDSGLGGLSVVAEIRRLLPGRRHVYLCDNAYYPYGLRKDADLLAHFLAVVESALALASPALVVAACNTISTIALPELRAMAGVPVVGVVPAIKPAAKLSIRRVVGLLATPATIDRPYTDRLIAAFADDCRVIRLGSSELVDMAEAKLRGIAPDPRAVERILAPFFDRPADQQPDVVVLACTHFPLLKPELAAASPAATLWIDSGAAVARRVADLLPFPPPDGRPLPADLALVTGDCDAALRPALASFGFPDIRGLAGSLSRL